MNRRVLLCIGWLGMANFVAFAIGALLIGGDAVSGMVQDGHYFVRNHGRLTEVSASVFHYSLWHARSLWVTHPVAAIIFGREYLRRQPGRGAGR